MFCIYFGSRRLAQRRLCHKFSLQRLSYTKIACSPAVEVTRRRERVIFIQNKQIQKFWVLGSSFYRSSFQRHPSKEQVVFTLRRGRHVGGRKQKISYQLLSCFHQQLCVAASLSVSLKIGCKPPIPLENLIFKQIID